ncbi:hypothetical protein ANCCAN_21909 [Ancylostoma caninum]|uniref:Uncharacterized protein n=1 Tax=Ancylostoma caninum TaxID=29170 RepID=A0A368FJ60_ANCCA|nr:hypothetical protein ANCCAN_21909 [Ancylostoma caninum]
MPPATSLIPPLLLAFVASPAHSQGICNSAPTAALRVICSQITSWATNSKSVPTVSQASVQSPGSAGAGLAAPVSALAISSNPTSAYECMDIACLCGFFGGTGGSNCVLRNGQRLGKALRKEYRVMTDAERRRLEIALRRVDPTLALPYWDSTLDGTLPNPRDSSLFTNELMGRQGPDGSIATGAFRGWRTVDGSRVFRRNVGGSGTLFQQSDINAVMAATDYRQVLAFTAPDQNCPSPAAWTALEYSHGNPHIYIGGKYPFPRHELLVKRSIQRVIRHAAVLRTMAQTRCSHSFRWLTRMDCRMHTLVYNLYSYAPRPTCSAANTAGCGSKFLFCDLSHGAPQCAAKIAVDGYCGGYSRNEDRCYLSVCQQNRCVRVQNEPTDPPIITTTPAGPTQEVSRRSR